MRPKKKRKRPGKAGAGEEKTMKTIQKMLPGCLMALAIAAVAKLLENLERGAALHRRVGHRAVHRDVHQFVL